MNKRLLKIVAAACSLAVVATASAGIIDALGKDSAKAGAYTLTVDAELNSEYAYGETITIPAASIDGVRASKFVVIAPSGNAYDRESLVLSEIGKYTVVWYANIGGKEVSAEKTFMVTQGAFSVNGGASWEYVESLTKVPTADLNNDNQPGTDGLSLTLEPESSFTYNKAIDLTDMSNPFAHVFPYHGITNMKEVSDALSDLSAQISAVKKQIKEIDQQIAETTDQALKEQLMLEKRNLEKDQATLEAKEAPLKNEYKYNDDARNYLITLTDCYDSSNYITIDLEWQEGRTYWNFRAGANGQTAHGLRSKAGDNMTVVGGVDYSYILAPGQGLTSCNIIDDYGLKLYYDVEEKAVYVTFCRYASGAYTLNERKIVADLDNAIIYPNNPFKGFTTGEVYLSISVKNHLDNAAHMDIASLGGISGQDLLMAEADTKAPTIQVNQALYEKNSIALNEEITIPDAYALDLNLPLGTKATASVYYAYSPNSTHNELVGLKDGKFTPKKVGAYTIVYTATDRWGNTSSIAVDLQCSSVVGNQAVNLTVDDALQAFAGQFVQVPECSVAGLYADASLLKTYVSIDGGEKVLLSDGQLFLDGVAEYELTYVYETPFKTYTATCLVTAAASDVVSMDDAILPRYFIKNATYTLDAVYAYEYTAKKPVPVLAQAFISEDGGEYVEINHKSVAIQASESVQFKYVHKGETKYSDKIKVVDVGFGGSLAMKDYFYFEANAFTSSASSEGVKLVANGTMASATAEYVNVLSLNSFSMDFTLLSTEKSSDVTYNTPTAITLQLIDFYDRNNVVTLRFANSSGLTKFYINGVLMETISRNFMDAKATVSYSAKANSFVTGGVNYAWNNIFSGDKIFLTVTLEGVEGSACLNISKLGGQKLSDAQKDKADPIMYLSKSNTGYQPYGKVITIGQAIAYDIIAPYVEAGLTLKVRKPDGSYAMSLDGVLLDGTCPVDREYQLKLDEVGIFSVLYEYVDQNGDYCSYVNSPTVRDEIPPVLKVEGKVENQVDTAKWGDTVAVANFTATDDISDAKNVKAWVCVYYPSGIVRDLDKGGSFYAEEKGSYTVLYYACDEMGNFSTFAYVVKVS